jgi:DNA-binding NtrC family response regulator
MDLQKKAHILLVDDEAPLTKLMKTYLAKIGYTVETALRADEAMALFDQNPDIYDLLVADLTLPDQPGQDMALQMIERSSRMKVLLCSGYPFAVESLPAAVQGRFSSLQKPFLPNMLADAIEDLLRRKID